MNLSRWELWQVYTTYLRCEFDVTAVAERLVSDGLAAVAMTDTGSTWVANEGSVTRGNSELRTTADGSSDVVYVPADGGIKLLSGFRLELWTDACAFLAADRKLVHADSSLMGPFVRLFLGEWRLASTSGDRDILAYPVLKLHAAGVVHLSFRVLGPDHDVDLATFIRHYRCLSEQRFSTAMAPVRFPELQPLVSSLWDRRPNWRIAKALSGVARDHVAAVRHSSGVTNDGDFAHRMAELQGTDHSFAEIFHLVVNIVAYHLREMRTSRWERIRGGQGIGPLLGQYWCGRPHIHLLRHDQQEDLASADAERNRSAYSAIVDGVASPGYRGNGLGDSLRPFKDHSVFVGRSAVLWVLSGEGVRRHLSSMDLNNRMWTPEAQVKGELIEYGHMLAQWNACEALDVDSLHSLMAQRRLLTIQHSMLRATQYGEVQALLRVAWERLDVPGLMERADKAFALSAAESTERLGQAEARKGTIYTVMFGVLAAPALSDSLIIPAVEAWLGVEVSAALKVVATMSAFVLTLAVALLIPFVTERRARARFRRR